MAAMTTGGVAGLDELPPVDPGSSAGRPVARSRTPAPGRGWQLELVDTGMLLARRVEGAFDSAARRRVCSAAAGSRVARW